MIYSGQVCTFWGASDNTKSLVVGTELDADGEWYIAFHVDGKPVLRNGVFGKRYGSKADDESPGSPDKRSVVYLSKDDALLIYDILGGIFSGIPSPVEIRDMESPEYNDGDTVDDLLAKLEGDK